MPSRVHIFANTGVKAAGMAVTGGTAAVVTLWMSTVAIWRDARAQRRHRPRLPLRLLARRLPDADPALDAVLGIRLHMEKVREIRVEVLAVPAKVHTGPDLASPA